MSSDQQRRPGLESSDDPFGADRRLSRRAALKGITAAGASATVLGVAAGSASAQELPHEIILLGTSERTEYRIGVSGQIERGSHSGEPDEVLEITDEESDGGGDVRTGEPVPLLANATAGETEDGGGESQAGDSEAEREAMAAVGKVEGGMADDFRFSGEFTSFELIRGNADVAVNGELVEAGDLVDGTHISIEGQGQATEYTFDVSEAVVPGSRANVDQYDEIDGTTVTGRVTGNGVDNYRYAGAISQIDVSGDASLRIDGEEVSPDDF